MPTYTNNLGITLPVNGEFDGTWGDYVNTNMNILDRATNGSVTLYLSGTSSPLTTSDGSTNDGQFKLLLLGGSPSGTHTITISPNDAQKIYFVRNTTAQSVVFTQGSGGDVTISAGDSGIIYSNGAGATAAVFNLTDDFAMSSVKITGGSVTGITDLAVADGGTGVSTLTGIVKGNGTSPFTAAVAGTDYLAPAAIGTTVQAWDSNLDQIAALTPTDSTFIVGNGAAWVAEDAATTRTSLGLGTIATQNSTSVSITGGTITGITSFSVSGTPTAPTAAVGTDTTQIATTAFVNAEIAADVGTANSAAVKTAINATGSAPIYACRAWVNFHGASTTGTYVRSGTLVTVTMTAHGMSTGMLASLNFTSGTATDGNYAVTVGDANSFTVTDTVSGGTSGSVTRNWFIRASGNVSSITDNGTGDYTLNFATALPDANYSCVFGAMGSSLTNISAGMAVVAGASNLQTLKTATQLRIQVGSSASGGLADNAEINVVIFR